MAERNPYEVLGVSRQASDGEIKRAFRKLARQYHPDRNQGDAGAEAKFKEVQAAYDAIGTSEARRCLLYTSPSPRDRQKSRMPSSA